MAKISQTIPQKEKASSSQSAADETPVEPRLEEYVPERFTKCLEQFPISRTGDEDEEEKENDGSALAARMKKTTDVPQAARSMVVHKALPRFEDISEKDSGGVPELLEIEDASHQIQRMGDMSDGALPECLRTEENAPSDSLGVVEIEDSPTFPSFFAEVIQEAQAFGALELNMPHDGRDPFRDLFTGVEDATGTSDASDLFYGVQQALNQAATVHREACSQSRTELHRNDADLQRVTEERNSLKLLLGKMGEEIKDIRAELSKANQDQADLSEQPQQKIEMIGKLREEVDVIKAESLKWKEGMDCFAAQKEAARDQLSSTKNQLQSMKEKGSVQARRIKELEARLASGLAKAEYDAKKAKADADTLVAIYQDDAEATQVQAREAAKTADTRAHWVVELAKCLFWRETPEEIHARGFDLAEDIKMAKELEADA
ncbi:uncharacterized protein [Nicotiana tomentosiformis]|uniref:uncharacterized protein n=1 Tax=Nicotiana tomentosiformis TaxID=4098 RepID=UPI00388C3AC2